MKTVLIIDDDLGFVFWLGRILADAGCQPLPAKGVSEACAWLSELNTEIDLLIVNPSLAGAADFTKTLRRSGRNVRILAALSNEDQPADQTQDADIVIRKPLQLDATAGSSWLKIVAHALGIPARRSRGMAI
jgi:hypothetical protein